MRARSKEREGETEKDGLGLVWHGTTKAPLVTGALFLCFQQVSGLPSPVITPLPEVIPHPHWWEEVERERQKQTEGERVDGGGPTHH